MNAFETGAILDDASHLTLLEPVPDTSQRKCRVIVLFAHDERMPAAWPPSFSEEIHIADPAFERPPQGEVPPLAALD